MATETYSLDIWTVGGEQECMNTLHFKVDTGADTNTLSIGTKLIDIFIDNWLDLLLELLPSNYSVVRLIARRVVPTASAQAKRWFNRSSKLGTQGNATAGNICPAVRLVPAMGGLSINRFFLPAVGDTSLVNNEYDSSYTDALDDFVGAMVAGATGSSVTAWLACYSKTHNTTTLVASWNLSGVIGYQRRRITPL